MRAEQPQITRHVDRRRWQRRRRILLGIVSIGLVITAIFPMDLQGAPSTRSGVIHTVSFLVNVGSILLASVLLSVGFGSDPRWPGFKRTAVTLALLLMLAFVLRFFTLHKGAPYGLANRLFVSVLIVWMLRFPFGCIALARQ